MNTNPMDKREVLLRELLIRDLKRKTGAPRLKKAPTSIIAADRTQSLPLSRAQQRLWFLEQLDPAASAAYYMPAALELCGSLDHIALQAALDRIIARHEILRTRFVKTTAGEPVQVIAPANIGFTLGYHDLRHLGEDEQQAAVARLRAEEFRKTFDFSRGPLIRGSLLQLADERHLLLFCQHHIVSDAWSIGILVREISALYAAFKQALPDPLPPLTIQYADYALWQRQWLQGEVLHQQIDFWHNHLAGAPALLELPTDQPRPSTQSYVGASIPLELPADLTAGLKALSQRHGTTLFMTLLAGWATLLARLSGQNDLVIGTPIANRQRTEIEPLIGFFVNTLALRIKLDDDPTVTQLLDRIKTTTLAAYAHQDVPFEQVVEAVQPARTLSHNPLFQVLLSLDNTTEGGSLRLPGLELTLLPSQRPRTYFDLSLTLTHTGEVIAGDLQYASDLFEQTSIERFAEHFQALLRAMTADDSQRVWELPLLTATERHRQLVEWNAPERPYNGQPFPRLFEAQAAAQPDAVALIYPERSLTYGQLNAKADRLARYLLDAGVTSGARVGIHLARSPELVIAVLGVLKAGAAYVPLEPKLPAERLGYMVRDAGIGWALLESATLNELPLLGLDVVLMDGAATDESWLDDRTHGDLPAVVPTDLAYVIYTSGSTGRPKGVMVEHRGLSNYLAHAAQTYLPGLAGSVVSSPLSFDATLTTLLAPLLAGKPVRLLPDDEHTLTRLSELLFSSNDRWLFKITPAHLEALSYLEHAVVSGTAPHCIVVGGEQLSAAALQRWKGELLPQASFVNEYGPTETVVGCCTWKLATAAQLAGLAEAAAAPIGRPIGNTPMYVLDGRRQPVPVGVTGEIYIGGVQVARGYLNRPDLTEERFLPDPFTAVPRARMYKTGDLGRHLPDGNLIFLGRNDFQVKIRGFRIELGEIEAQLLACPGVRAAAVIAREDTPGDKRLVAYLVPDEGVELSGGELRTQLAATLAEYMVPSAYVTLASLPLTPNGKLDRLALAAPGTDAYVKQAHEAPTGEIETAIAVIWQELLHIQRVGRHDHFFQLGGHSLLAVQLISRLRQVLGADVALRDLFAAPTLAALAKRVAGTTALELPPIQCADRTQDLPLSWAQQRLWFLAQLDPAASIAYHIPAVLQLQGSLDRAALSRALEHVVTRHEVLRTRFAQKADGTPVQITVPANIGFTLGYHDLRHLGEDEQQTAVARLRAEEFRKSFDFSRGPLIRGSLLQLADEHHLLLFCQHHIVSDAWSIGILVREISALYAAFKQALPDPLPPLAIQYADYALWQRQWLQGEVLHQQIDFWRNHLAGAPALLELPTDQPRPSTQSYVGASIPLELPADLTAALKALSQRHGTTLFMTLLAGWATLLARLSGQNDLVIGTPIANRQRTEIEPLIGFFVNTLALRIKLDDDPTVTQLLDRIKTTTLAAYAHQDLPFEQVVEAVQPARTLSHSPLFQVLLSLDNTPEGAALTLPQLTVTSLSAPHPTTHFDLSLLLSHSGAAIAGNLQYASDLYLPATIERLAVQFQALLRAMVADDQQHVALLPLLSPADRHQLLVEWNATETPYTRQLIHQAFEAQVAADPNAPALVCRDRSLTYGELNAKANQLAHYLLALGVRPDDRVAICVERSLEMVVGLLGIIKAGAAYVPLDPNSPRARLAFVLEDCAPVALLTQAALLESLPETSIHRIVLDDQSTQTAFALLPSDDIDPATLGLTPAHLAYVIYTSGSTGSAKGVMVEHQSALNFWQVLRDTTHRPCPPRARIGLNAAYFFDMSLKGLLQLLSGHCVVIIPQLVRADGAALLHFLEQQRIDAFDCTPSQLDLLLAAGLLDSSYQPKSVLIGGEAIDAATWQRLGRAPIHFYNMYGPTECTVDATIGLISAAAVHPHIGRPVANTRIYLLDTRRQPVPIGVTGEIYIGGVQVARGYLNRPDLTEERFLPDPFSTTPNARMYKTGDLGRYLPDGNIAFLGRNDFQVKIRGFRIELGEIEAQLLACRGVREAVVIAREDSEGDKRLVAYLVPEEGVELSIAEVRAQLASALVEYMVPAAYVTLASVPLTPNGKLDRHALPAPDADAYLKRAYEAPEGEIELTIAGIWQDLLHVESVGRHDHFFELGGHSLLAVQLVSRLREVLGVDVALRDLFATPTLAALAKHVTAAAALLLPPIRSADRSQNLPLSWAQQRLWFLAQLDQTASIAYYLPAALRLRGVLDSTALAAALNRIVARHEILRTCFVKTTDGTPVQVIAPANTGFALSHQDLTGLGEDEQQATLARLCEEERRRSVDFESGPLIRGQLVRLADDHNVLLFYRHHIISDGWSIGILVREITALYAAFVQGLPDPLPPLTLQYADYALWQRQWLRGNTLQRQIDFWRQHLADAPALLGLPTDHPRPATQSFAGARISLVLPADLTVGLKALSQRHGTTLFMTLLAGWSTLLARLSGQDDVVIGTPVANRQRTEIEALIGFFVNTLALRIKLEDNPTVTQLLERIKTTTLAAYAHQDVPFEQVVETLQPVRALNHNPLFQAVLSLNNTPRSSLTLPGLELTLLPPMQTLTHFDLSLSLTDTNQVITGDLHYSSDLFEQATIERFAGHFQTLLRAMVADDSQPIGELAWLTPAERHQLLVEWNATQTPYPERPLHQIFEAHAAAQPKATALLYRDQSLTYGELNIKANQLAHHLLSLGIRPDDRVAICVERGFDMIVGVLGVLKAGGAYVPLDPAHPDERLAFMLTDSAPAALVTQTTLKDRLQIPDTPIVTLDDDTIVAQQPSHNPDPRALGLTPEHLAYIIYTSGSTGKPKGVMNLHRNLTNLTCTLSELANARPGCRMLQLASFGFDVCVSEIAMALGSGACLCLAAPEDLNPGEALLMAIQQRRITHLGIPVPMLAALPSHISLGSTVETLFTGVEVCPTSVARLWAGRYCLLNAYGPTETTVCVSVYRCQPDQAGAVPIGRPIANTTLYLLDAHRQPVPIGVTGEIYIGGVQVARGYLNLPDLTEERFLPDPFSTTPDARMYKTGDLARYLPDGNIVFLGRNDFQVKIRGFRIELGEIEAQLLACPGVHEAVVVAREPTPGDKRLVAYLVPEGGVALSIAELRAQLATVLAEYMVPAAYVTLPYFPLTPNGKLDREALPAPGADAYLNRAYEAPSGDIETAIAAIWRDLLHVERIGRHDHFFELGGHSLLAVQLVSRMRQALGVDVALRDLFATPTLTDLAQRVAAGSALVLPPIQPADRTQSLPLSWAQQRLWFMEQLDPAASAAYHMPAALELRGCLDRAALGTALDRIVARHEILRTTFVKTAAGEPVQVIARGDVGFTLTYQDLRSLEESAQNAAIARARAAEFQQPFDFQNGPLIHGKLLQLADDRHLLLFCQHHIISDAWSIGILVREISALYAASLQKLSDPLPPLQLQYADYALWQRQWLQGEALQRQIEFWRDHLAGAPTLLELPTDHPRPPTRNFASARIQLELPADLTDGLKALSQRHGVTLFMTLLAGWATLLARLSGQNDLVVGTPIANRQRAEIESLIGFFVNTLALRIRLDDDLTVAQLLERIKTTTVAAYAHQDIPFEQIVEAVQPARALGHHPLFQVLLSLNNTPEVGTLTLPGLKLTPLPAPRTMTHFDLSLSLVHSGGLIAGELHYPNDLFEPATVARIAAYFQTLLRGMVADDQQRIALMPLLSSTERHQLLVEWNATQALYSGQLIHQLFEAQAAAHPDTPALRYQDRSLTYRELDTRANQLAHHLLALGIRPDDRVAVCLERSPNMVIGLLGVLKAGGAYVPLDPQYPQERLGFMLADSAPVALLTQTDLLARMPTTSVRRVVLDDATTRATIDSYPTDSIDPSKLGLTPAHLAYVIYTSGSTGWPKGVMCEHRGLTNLALAQIEAFGIEPGSRVLQFASFSFDACVSETAITLCRGATLCLTSYEDLMPGEPLLKVLCDERITCVTLPPVALAALPAHSELPDLECLIVAGEACPPALAALWAQGRRFINAYGPTETTVCATIHPYDNSRPGKLPIGRPMANMCVYILDAHLQPVPPGVSGEIFVGGVGVARGYLHREELTVERFLDNPFSATPHARMYRTGDLGRWLPDGNVEYLGRHDTQVKLRGFRIEPGEIESCLRQHQRVKDAVVIAREDVPGDKRLVAYLQLEKKIELWPSVSEFYVYDELLYHAMAAHASRNRCYAEAFARHLPGKTVVEIGPGPHAVLARMAIAAGASKVYAIELLERSFQAASHKLRELGLEDRIILIHGDATRVELPERVDYCISEIVGNIGGSEGAAVIINHARRFLKEPAHMIPERSLSRIVAVSLTEDRLEYAFSDTTRHYVEQIFASTGGPFDLRVCVKDVPAEAILSTSDVFEDLDYTRTLTAESDHSITLQVEKAGVLTGFMIWMVLYVDAQNVLDTYQDQGSWLPVYFPVFSDGVAVAAGDRIVATLSRRVTQDLYPDFFIDGAIHRVDGRTEPFQGTLPHRSLEYRASPFYQRLFADQTIPVTPQMTPQSLRAHLLKRLPEYMVPGAFITLPSFPLTPNGKLDRRALPAPEQHAVLAGEYEPPRGETELAIAAIWRELLRLEQVGHHDHFFESGGHSLLAVRMLARVRDTLGVEVSLRELFAYPRLDELALIVGQALQVDRTPIPAADRSQPLPLSFAQQRLWFLAQLDPAASVAYHMPAALELRGSLDRAALAAALDRIAARHEILRTTFVKTTDGPVQSIAPANSGFPLSYHDLTTLDEDEQRAAVARLRADELQHPFDFASEPSIRGRLLQLADEQHLLLLCQHHIVSDGWSIGILVREISTLYAAFIRKAPDPLPPLDLQYADYALWQRQWLQGEALQEQIDFWRTQLAGAPAVLELPTDHPRPAIQSYAGASIPLALPADLAAGLRTLSQRHGTTLFMTLLAGWSVLLARLTGQNDLVIGTPTANRQRTQIESLIGFFLNMLALRVRLDDDPTVTQLLDRIKATTLAAYAHQDVPFEQVVEAVQPVRTLSHSPLFQVLLSLNNTPEGGALVLPGLELTPLPSTRPVTHFDLSLSLTDSGDVIAGDLQYSSDLFEPATIERIAGHFQTLLRAMVADDSQHLGELSLLTAAERHRLLVEWNDTERPCPGQLIQQLFEAQAATCPNAPALRYQDQSLTYGELNTRANQLAHHLLLLGIRPEDRIAICVERSLEMVIGLLAILKAGGAYVPLDPEYPQERLAFMLTDSAPVVLLTQAALRARIPETNGRCVVLDDANTRAVLASHPSNNLDPATLGLTPAHLAYVIYTSGSTGKPKGVMIEHAAVVNFLQAMSSTFAVTPRDSLLAVTTLSFDIAGLELYLPLINGASVNLVGRVDAGDARFLQEAIGRLSITLMQATPATWRMLLNAGWQGAPDMKALCGGEALPTELSGPLSQRVASAWNLYGPTETTIWATCRRVAPGSTDSRIESIGRPIANTRTYLLDARRQPVPIGVIGEIYIGGVQVARGYLNRPDLTEERFVPDPFSTAANARMYRTGDLGRYLPDGNIAFLGRNDFQVKVRGFRIEPGEIEAQLLTCPGVREAVVTARADALGEQRLVAYLVPEEGAQLSVGELRTQLAARLAEYMVPTAYVTLRSLPLTPNGKLDRRALPAPEGDAYVKRAYEAPTGEIEIALAAIWQDLLQIERVGRHDHFFELGGHSLMLVTLVERLRQQKLTVDLRAVFTTPTLAALAAAVSPEEASAAVVVPRNRIPVKPQGNATDTERVVI